jgi:hypothetical protein
VTCTSAAWATIALLVKWQLYLHVIAATLSTVPAGLTVPDACVLQAATIAASQYTCV